MRYLPFIYFFLFLFFCFGVGTDNKLSSDSSMILNKLIQASPKNIDLLKIIDEKRLVEVRKSFENSLTKNNLTMEKKYKVNVSKKN